MDKGIIKSGGKEIPVNFSIMPIDKIVNLTTGQHAYLYTGYRKDSVNIINVKINGMPKRWKREPDRVEVPVKYGLYECARVCYRYGSVEDENLYFVELEE